MQKALHTYFMRYRFTHPTKEDFLKTFEEVSGKDLRWYFNQAVYGSSRIQSGTHAKGEQHTEAKSALSGGQHPVRWLG